jgi:hypothetical protein
VSKKFFHKIWGLFRGELSGDWREFEDRGEERHFQPLGEASQAVLRLIWAHRYLPLRIPHLFLRLKVSIPGVVGVPIKVIVFYGELRELIQDISGRP